jgi:predicted PurR-regulated permease PerM
MSINTAIFQFGQLAQNLNSVFTSPTQFNHSPLIITIERFGISQQQISQVGEQLIMQVEQLTTSIVPFLSSFFTLVVDTLLVAILSIYLLTDGSRFVRKLKTNAPVVHRRRITNFMKTIERIAGGYIRGQTTLAAIIGILIGVGMALFQVPYAVLLGVLSFILEFIPILGTLIAGAICVLLALTKGWIIAVLVLGYFIVMHVIEGDILGPRIVGKAVGLHPLVSLIALIAGTELFGITGALFASPVAGIIQSVLVSLWSDWKDDQVETP